MDELHKIPVRQVGNRPNLFMGGDRELVMFSGLLAFVLIFAAQDLIALVAGLGLWFVAVRQLREMAKYDPLLRYVYLRHRTYQKHYPPRSTPFRINQRAIK